MRERSDCCVSDLGKLLYLPITQEGLKMLAIGNDELESNSEIGETIQCKHCGKVHKIKYGDEVLSDGTRKPSKLLSFYNCGDKTYLAGIKGKAI